MVLALANELANLRHRNECHIVIIAGILLAAAGFRGLVETLVSVWALRPIPFLRECVLERVKGIEPSFSAWEADVLPLNYTRKSRSYLSYTAS